MVAVASSIKIVLRSAIIFQNWVMHIFLTRDFKQKKTKRGKTINNNWTETEKKIACLLNKPEKYETLAETARLNLGRVLLGSTILGYLG